MFNSVFACFWCFVFGFVGVDVCVVVRVMIVCLCFVVGIVHVFVLMCVLACVHVLLLLRSCFVCLFVM